MDTKYEQEPDKADKRDLPEATINEVGIEATGEDEPVVFTKQLIRKIDKRIIPSLAVLYVISYIDRASLGNASIFGYRDSLGINVTQYNLIVTVFYFGYGLFEYPLQMIMPRFRPSLWLASICFAWGLVTTLSALTHNFAGAMVARLFVGITEAGFFPGAMYLVSQWYPREYLATRIAAFYCFGVFAGSFSGLLAYAINYMDGVGGITTWRWMFILEGIATCLIAFGVYLAVPDHPTTSKWLTEEERAICNDHLAKSGVNASHHFSLPLLKAAFTDYKVLICIWLACCSNIAVFGFSFTLPSILVQMGYTAANAQLMTIPFYAVSAVLAFGTAIISDRVRMRGPFVAIGFGVTFLGLLIVYLLPRSAAVGVRYFFSLWILSGIYMGFPSVLSWLSNNTAGVMKRNTASTLQLGIANFATAIGTNSYLGAEAPRYPTGFGVGMGVTGSAVVAAGLLMFLLNRENKRRAKMDISHLTREEIIEAGDKSPAFRYIL